MPPLKPAARSPQLRADLDPPLMETLRLLVTELVTNSVRHTECDSLTLRVAIGKAAVLTEVADDGPSFDADVALEAEQLDSRAEDTGWGLFLVQRLARDWGVKQDERSKRVWFELAAPRASAVFGPGASPPAQGSPGRAGRGSAAPPWARRRRGCC